MQDWYLTFKGGEARRVYLSKIEERVVNGRPVYGYYYKGDEFPQRVTGEKKRTAGIKAMFSCRCTETSWANINRYIR